MGIKEELQQPQLPSEPFYRVGQRIPEIPILTPPLQIFTDGIVRPQEIMGLTRPDKDLTYLSANYGIPIHWRELDVADRFEKQEQSLDTRLHFTDLTEVGTHLFEHREPNKTLEKTLAYISGVNKAKAQSLTGWWLTFGAMNHILMYEAIVKGKPYYFTVCLARSPFDEDIANLSHRNFLEYQMLSHISRNFRTFLTEEAAKKYQVVSPIAPGFTKYQGDLYFYYTMPFVPYGEINVDLAKADPWVPLPYYFYAHPFNKTMEDISTIHKLQAQQGTADQENWQESVAMQAFRAQRRDYLTGYSLLWLLGTFEVPTSHFINAGDAMGVLRKDGLDKLVWISIRGGVTRSIKTLRDFITHVREMTEKIPYFDDQYHFYQDLSDEEVKSILEDALCLIKPEMQRLIRMYLAVVDYK